MNSNEIRRRFLQFFADRGHAIVKSSSLIPAEDPTLLFVNAGMNQFKDVFLGREQRSYTTATSCQKCVRAGGKHNDLDNVGHTRRHQTFFEMLGNFSFGGYFKKEAIDYAWTLLTREFKLPIDKLWVTIFREDDDAAKSWISGPGVARDRILRLDEKDNFWQMGDTGPCGPCSEIHYDLGPAASELGHTNCAFPCDCGRYVEIWNLVFMQFDRDSEGHLSPLPKPSIDTGMGLERIASVLQGKISNYETDLLRPIIDEACQLFNVEYGGAASSDVSLRIIADHVRAATFLISDGVIPSNEGRGYVLRKIMRRGIRQGTLLGYKEPFLYTLSGYVVEMMKEAYPELIHTREYVARVIKTEEERFAAMVTVGLQRLEQTIHQLVNSGKDVIPGIEIFKLYDTYGFPLDFTKEIADEKSMRLDMDGFEAELEKQRERARQSWRGDETAVSPFYEKFVGKGGTPFLGYDAIRSTSRIAGFLVNGMPVDSVGGGQTAEIILDETPFYAESGGQVGDTGTLTSPSGVARVLDTYSPLRGVIVHKVQMEFGNLAVNDEIQAQVDEERRLRIAANHTGTHILHAVLRETLGTHVKQAGSLVAPDRLRFDYTHFAPLTDREIEEIEQKINRIVFRNLPVQTEIMEINQAIARGALAFFGEKYQQQVRVVSIPEVSMELCGGTHTRMTGDVGLFKIVGESSIASGIRRIEALTGFGTFVRLEEDENLLQEIAHTLRTPRTELTRAITRLLEQQRHLENELEALKRRTAKSQIGNLVESPATVKGISVVSRRVEGVDASMLRELAENAGTKIGSGVVVLGLASDGKASLVAVVSQDLQKRLHAGRIIKEVAALVGGSGGGRPDFAQAGGKNAEKLEEALQAVYNIVAEFLV
ncbi:MAG: alanine--tRNA ligase [Acidobacteria bacterium 13_1_40CM_3_56_11]|nr:MAG: alanine--tRNA ligase [Acidobacteria bacterium 13_1_40CM_56_16]OLD22194.1 MAG: alanine--tRNA ligase [Acidobacteria bacterium 13_1_40CM_3_56_11]